MYNACEKYQNGLLYSRDFWCNTCEHYYCTVHYFISAALHRPQRSADTQGGGNTVNTSSFPYIECCEDEMEGMGEMGCLVPVDHKDHKDREETKE